MSTSKCSFIPPTQCSISREKCRVEHTTNIFPFLSPLVLCYSSWYCWCSDILHFTMWICKNKITTSTLFILAMLLRSLFDVKSSSRRKSGESCLHCQWDELTHLCWGSWRVLLWTTIGGYFCLNRDDMLWISNFKASCRHITCVVLVCWME